MTNHRFHGSPGFVAARTGWNLGNPWKPWLVAAVLTGAACAHAPRTPRNDPAAREWIDLFDGHTLNGWTAKIAKHEVGDNYANTFRVRDGIIEARYDGYGPSYDMQFGHLYYDRPFSYYLLSMDYRLLGSQVYPGAPAYTIRNSGVMIHSQDPRTMPRDQNFPISVEVQFLGGMGDGKARPTGNMCSPGTAVVLNGKLDPRHCINSTSKTIDGDAWVHMDVLVLGDSIVKTMVDGDTVLVYEKPQMALGVVTGFDPAMLHAGQLLTGGYIALQAEGHPVDFRNVRVLNLEGCTDRQAANYKAYRVHAKPADCTYANGRRP